MLYWELRLPDKACCSFSSILPEHRKYGEIRQLADDNIGHDWILKNIPINKTILKKWLKSGYIEKKRLFPTKKGTPQGGTISPLIMNMVLDGLETLVMKKFPRWKRQIRQPGHTSSCWP